MNFELPGGNDHPSWLTAIATAIGYGAIFTFILLALFVVPYLAFTALG